MARKLKGSRWNGKRVSVIIPANNEAKLIGKVVREVRKLGRQVEILVVANGCKDKTIETAAKAGAKVIQIPERLGHDVGRSIGAKYAKGDILLFVDADMVIGKSDLERFISAVAAGNDIALNAYPLVRFGQRLHPVNLAKASLNVMLGRWDLKASNMTAVPHAISRKAVEKIGLEALAIPPLAHARSIVKGLKVARTHFVNVGAKNPLRKSRYRNGKDPIQSLILGDCLEAIHYVTNRRGPRGGFTDLGRARNLIASELQQAVETAAANETKDIVAVVPVKNEEHTIGNVVSAVRQTGVERIIVVSNGTIDNSARLAEQQGAQVIKFDQAVGHDVGRSLGVLKENAQAYLFLDGDFQIRRKDLAIFLDSIKTNIDIGLNDLTGRLRRSLSTDPVTMLKVFLNMILNRRDLGAASLTAVPHVMSGQAIHTIGIQSLSVPPLAQTKAILAGLQVKAVHEVNVIQANRYRAALHQPRFGKPLQKLIVGDHLEALHYLTHFVDARGVFHDTNRRRDLLNQYVTLSNPVEIISPKIKSIKSSNSNQLTQPGTTIKKTATKKKKTRKKTTTSKGTTTNKRSTASRITTRKNTPTTKTTHKKIANQNGSKKHSKKFSWYRTFQDLYMRLKMSKA